MDVRLDIHGAVDAPVSNSVVIAIRTRAHYVRRIMSMGVSDGCELRMGRLNRRTKNNLKNVLKNREEIVFNTNTQSKTDTVKLF
jgi:hypothetical protein